MFARLFSLGLRSANLLSKSAIHNCHHFKPTPARHLSIMPEAPAQWHQGIYRKVYKIDDVPTKLPPDFKALYLVAERGILDHLTPPVDLLRYIGQTEVCVSGRLQEHARRKPAFKDSRLLVLIVFVPWQLCVPHLEAIFIHEAKTMGAGKLLNVQLKGKLWVVSLWQEELVREVLTQPWCMPVPHV